MDPRRLRAGEWLLALAGVGALVAPFLPWYGAGSTELTGWEALSVVDALLFVTGVLAIAVVAFTAQQSTAAAPIAVQTLFMILAAVVSVVVLVRVLDVREGLGSRQFGAWLALACAAGMAGAALLAMRDERLDAPGRPTDSTGVPIDAEPEIETLPAPPRA